jgi:hypothetical protein
MDPLAADAGYSGARGVATIGAPDRVLPPQATVDLKAMGMHSFQTKVKDTCVRCKGIGESMGLVCALCSGSGLDEVGRGLYTLHAVAHMGLKPPGFKP